MQEDLILASASPRRAAILKMLGFDFEVVPANIEEGNDTATNPAEHARALAREKARAIRRPQGLSIGADTIVVVAGRILGKPRSAAEAFAMLCDLRGRWHRVHTGIALHDLATARGVDDVETTSIRFHAWEDDVLRRYVDTGECDDKAGAYAIQGLGAMLVQEIRGCFYNVMGLPVERFITLLREFRAPEVERAG
ncbi:MAG: septum formation protein Maf [Candidatus Latescibacterota bacterium]|nr:MAG: septum formation protein Maf [Candidatus Latescibacterota bacterium]